MTSHRITPSFTIIRDGGRLSVQTSHKRPHALVFGAIDAHTAGALRALADEIDRGPASTITDHETPAQGGFAL